MSSWAWIIGGAIMLGAELAWVDAQFYLVFIGSAAILVGIAVSSLADVPVWSQWVGFATLAVVSMTTFRRRVYERVRARLPTVAAGPAGGTIELPQALAPGASCQIEHAGSYWTVHNQGGRPLAAGARVRIERVEGLSLVVGGD